MVKCIFVIMALSGEVTETVGVFQSCDSAVQYITTHETDDVVLIHEEPVDSCVRSLMVYEEECA